MTLLRFHSLLFSFKKVYSTKISAAENLVSSLASKVTKDNQYEILSDVITPLWKIDYCEQILIKKQWSKEILNTIKTKHLPKVKTSLHNVIPSVQITKYRTKDAFSINVGIDGNPKTVGFYVGSFAQGGVVCIPPSHLITLKANHIEVAKVFQDFIRASPFTACHQLKDLGFWRGITVTSNCNGEIQAVIVVHPNGITESDIEPLKQNIIKYFQDKLPLVKSLYIQFCAHSRCSAEQAPFNLLYGDEYIYENIDRYIFRISPDSFLQNNIQSLPSLYDSILNLANINKNYTLLDLNCGIGTFSIYVSNYVRGCMGIDSSKLAIANATFNSRNNGIQNCHFVYGPLEKELLMVFKELDSTLNIAVVVNASTVGISKDIIKMLRRCIHLKKVICIFSKADNLSSMRSIINLCHPKFDLSYPFNITAIQPVDMSPQTKYCDLVMLFTRK